jgi:Enolase C-terminal domain-like
MTSRPARRWRGPSIPVATGENNYTRFEFRELIERRAARYLMPDVCRANGFTETLRIGQLAAAHQMPVSPHVVHELSLHVAAALPFALRWRYAERSLRNAAFRTVVLSTYNLNRLLAHRAGFEPTTPRFVGRDTSNEINGHSDSQRVSPAMMVQVLIGRVRMGAV